DGLDTGDVSDDVVIELGAREEATAGRAATASPRRRRAVLTAVAVLCAGVLVGSTAQVSPLRLLWSARIDQGVLSLGAGALYGIRSGEGVVALSLADGTERWRLDATGTPAGITESGVGQVLVQTEPGGTGPVSTTIVDAATGRSHGEYPGAPFAVV